MTHVMLRRYWAPRAFSNSSIFPSARGRRPFPDDVILMEHMAHKVAIVELMHQLAVDFGRQMFEPLGIVTAQGDIQRQNISTSSACTA